ncbi:rhomboid family intramembrane serine protease [Clostridium sp. DL1XJH146]
MKWLNRLEIKYKKYAINNLMLYILALNGFVFLLGQLSPSAYYSVYTKLTLDPSLVLNGEVWRLVTFLFIPFSTSFLWMIIALYFYYMIGTTLERQWGSFKFNMYYLIGILATIAAAFLTGSTVTNENLNLSLFLAFAYLFPNFEVLLFFILPIKMKYLGYFNWALIAYTVIFSSGIGQKIAAIASVVNFFVFFGKDFFKDTKIKWQVYKNKKRFESQMNKYRK